MKERERKKKEGRWRACDSESLWKWQCGGRKKRNRGKEKSAQPPKWEAKMKKIKENERRENLEEMRGGEGYGL